VAKTCTKDGHKQTTKTSTKIQTKRKKKHRTTEEEMEGPTSSWGLRNRLTCLTLQEDDDDDNISEKTVIKTICVSVNHTRFPKEDHLPDWARRDNKVTKGDRVENGLVRFAERRNLVSARVPSHFNWPLPR